MSESAIPEGSKVLVTGANGFIASKVAEALLERGYRVRGTTRDQAKGDEIAEYFRKKYGSDSFELRVVPDMSADGAFDKLLEGCSAVSHVAWDFTFRSDPHAVITPMLTSLDNLLKAAAATPSIKRFVLTSASSAAVRPKPGVKFHVDKDSWAEEAVREAWARQPPYPEGGLDFTPYAASKVQGEQAMWKFVREEKPGFVANSVLPNHNIGRGLWPGQRCTSADVFRDMYNGGEFGIGFMQTMTPQRMINVEDDALIHLAALTFADVQNKRLFAMAEPFNYARVVETFKKIDPTKTFPPNPEGQGEDLCTVATEDAEEILKRFGRPGFASLEQSLRETLGAA